MTLLGAVHPLGERGEVQRHLRQPALAQQLGGRATRNSVRPLGVAGSRRMNDSDTVVAAVDGHEVQDAADRAALVAGEHDQRLVASAGVDRVHRHREAALGRALAAALEHPLDLAQRVVVELRGLVQLGGVAGLGQAGDRLADLADRPALEGEAVELDDRLVAEVDRAQPELLVQRREPLAGADRAELQPALVRRTGARSPSSAGNAPRPGRPGRRRAAARRSRPGSRRTRCRSGLKKYCLSARSLKNDRVSWPWARTSSAATARARGIRQRRGAASGRKIT